jgi:hypothetical protein
MKQQTDEEFVYSNLGDEIYLSSVKIGDQVWRGWMYSSLPESPFSYAQALAAEAKKPSIMDLIRRNWGSSAKRDKRQKEVPKKNPATERKGEYRTLMN